VELPKVKASFLYPSKNQPKPSGPTSDRSEYNAVDNTMANVILMYLSLLFKTPSRTNINRPKLIKYHRPVVLVATDQKELLKSRPVIADTVIDMKSTTSIPINGDFINNKLFPLLSSHIDIDTAIIDTNTINHTERRDVPPYRNELEFTNGKKVKNIIIR
jgi:hypothetical protein